jgi:maltooligosyltrehalose synthase
MIRMQIVLKGYNYVVLNTTRYSFLKTANYVVLGTTGYSFLNTTNYVVLNTTGYSFLNTTNYVVLNTTRYSFLIKRAMIYKTIHRKLKIEQHEPHLKLGVNSGDLEE